MSPSSTAASSPVSEYLSVREAARLLGVGPRTIYTLIQRGELRAVPINGRDLRIRRSWLDDCAEKLARHSQPQPAA